ncbi:hypothetical protein EHRUM3_03580 [Ehrlichia ruminantium]|uniref:Uncharacterized protein n=1 Tax=Ehrlichia ruminantium TaxID=779 RepID=A0A170SM86_EHRRU|nr:hypothetical protein [Ehrlichia ruminantium]GAT78145.1 hypothetical protein EHRUM3_03580 [Ehrlichia ruminantium]
MRKIKLTNNQRNLLKFINALIVTHTPKSYSFLRNCFSYISEKLDRKVFGKRGTVHEACTVVTEEVRNHIIMNSHSLEDYSSVISSIDQQLIDKIGSPSLLTNLCLQLERKVSTETRNNYRIAMAAFGDTEDMFDQLTANNSFNPGVLEHYIGFISGYINRSNSKVLYKEAYKVLSITCLLTPQNILLRGLARAAIYIINNNSNWISNPRQELFTEFCTSVSLNITAHTRSFREDTIASISAEFAQDHPMINWLLNTSNHFNNQYSSAALYASMGASFAIFITRIHAEYAVTQARNDILQALNGTQNITIYQNRTIYDSLIKSGNNTFDNSTGNITVYAPNHSSQYFPQNEGWFNGMVEWIPCALRMTLLLFVLPRAFLSPIRKNYILQRYKSIELTPQQRLAHRSLVGSMVWRWACVASMQPGRVVTSQLNDQVFKWSALRFIVPATFIEEALKIESIANSHYKLSCRNISSSRFHTPLPIIYTCCAASLVLEYTSISIDSVSQPVSRALTIFTKLIRPAALVLPLIINRNRTQFFPATRTVAYASMLRLGATGIFLPLFDLARGQTHWESVTGGLLQVASAYSDRAIGTTINTINNVELHLAIINPMTQSATQSHGTIALLLPIIEQGHQRHKYNMSVAEIAALLEEQVGLYVEQQHKRTSSPSIVEVTDEEAEQIIREQEERHLSRRQYRSDLNAPLEKVTIEPSDRTQYLSRRMTKFTTTHKHKHRKKLNKGHASNSDENICLLSLTQFSSSIFIPEDTTSTTPHTTSVISTNIQNPSSNICAPTVCQSLPTTPSMQRRHSI